MHLIGSLRKVNRISEVLTHGSFLENFIKSWKISLVTDKKFKQFQPRIYIDDSFGFFGNPRLSEDIQWKKLLEIFWKRFSRFLVFERFSVDQNRFPSFEGYFWLCFSPVRLMRVFSITCKRPTACSALCYFFRASSLSVKWHTFHFLECFPSKKRFVILMSLLLVFLTLWNFFRKKAFVWKYGEYFLSP